MRCLVFQLCLWILCVEVFWQQSVFAIEQGKTVWLTLGVDAEGVSSSGRAAFLAGAEQAMADLSLQTGRDHTLKTTQAEDFAGYRFGEGGPASWPMLSLTDAIPTLEKLLVHPAPPARLGLVIGTWQTEALAAAQAWFAVQPSLDAPVIAFLLEPSTAWGDWVASAEAHPTVDAWLLLTEAPLVLRPPAAELPGVRPRIWVLGDHPRLLQEVADGRVTAVLQARWFEQGYHAAEQAATGEAVTVAAPPLVIMDSNLTVWRARWTDWLQR